MGKVVMYSTVSVDGFIADENDQPGPLFDWLTSGDVPLDESGVVKVSQTSHDYIRPYWDQIGVTIVGRHVFDMTDGWGGTPPAGIDHVVVVSHRPAPKGWRPEAPFHFVDGVEAAMAKAQELAGDRTVEVAAGDVGGQVLAARLVDEVAMDVAPVVFGSGKRYFGSVDAQHLLEDPAVVVQGTRVLQIFPRAPVAGKELVGSPAEQERVGALVGLVDERQGLVVEHPHRPAAALESASAVLIRRGAVSLHDSVDCDLRHGREFHGSSFLPCWSFRHRLRPTAR